jgi:preprotein translocase subunit SecD
VQPRVILIIGVLMILFSGVPRAQARFEIRAAAGDSVSGWQKMALPDGDGSVWVAPDASLTSSDIARAQPATSPDGHPAVAIALTDAGAAKMRELSAAQDGNLIAMVLDGKVIWAPVVRGEIGRNALITGGRNGLAPDEVRRLVAGVSQR